MAAVDLLVRIKSAGGKVLSGLSKDAKNLNQNIDSTNHSLGELDRNLKGTANATSNGTKAFAKMSQGLGGLVRVYAVFAANLFAASAAFEGLRRAARVEQLTQAMEAFGMSTGVAMQSLTRQMRIASGSALDFETSMRAAAQGTTAGFSSEQILGITKVATNAAKVLGRDTADSIDRLIRGLAKLEPELIDELGLMTRLSEATTNYARQQGKSVTQLTFFEKKMAFANAVLEEGTRKYDALGKAIKANPFDQISSSISDLTRQLTGVISQPIADTVIAIGSTIKELVNGIKSVFTTLGLSGETASKILLGSLAAISLFFATKLVPSITDFRHGLAITAKEGSERLAEIVSSKVKAQQQTQVQGLLAKTDNPYGRVAQETSQQINTLNDDFNKNMTMMGTKAGMTAQSVQKIWKTALDGGVSASNQAVKSLDFLRSSASSTIRGVQDLSLSKANKLAAVGSEERKLADKMSRQGISSFADLERYATQKAPGKKSQALLDEYNRLKAIIELEQRELMLVEQTTLQVQELAAVQANRVAAVSAATVAVEQQPPLPPVLTKEQQIDARRTVSANVMGDFLDEQKKKSQGILGIRKMFSGFKDIGPALDNYKAGLAEVGVATDTLGARAGKVFLGMKLSALTVGEAIKGIATRLIQLISVIGLVVMAWDMLKGAFTWVLDFFTSDSVKKYVKDTEEATKKSEEFATTLKEISDNAIGFNNLLKQGDYIGAINQKYNAYSQVVTGVNKQLEDQNSKLVEAEYLLDKVRQKEQQRVASQNINYSQINPSDAPGATLGRSLAEGTSPPIDSMRIQANALENAKTALNDFANSINTTIDISLMSDTTIGRLEEFDSKATSIANTLKTKFSDSLGDSAKGINIVQDDLGRLSVEVDKDKVKAADLSKIHTILKDTLNSVIDKKTITTFQNYTQSLVETNKAATQTIQNIRNSVLPSNDYLQLRDTLISLKTSFEGVNSILNDSSLMAKDNVKNFAKLSEVATSTGKALSDEVFNVGIGALANDPTKQQSAIDAITRFKELQKVEKSIRSDIENGPTEEIRKNAQARLEGFKNDISVQQDYKNTLAAIYTDIVPNAISKMNDLATQTQKVAIAQEALNATYDKFTIASKTAAGPIIDLAKQKDSIGVSQKSLDLQRTALELFQKENEIKQFKPSEGVQIGSDQYKREKQLFDLSQQYAVDRYNAEINVLDLKQEGIKAQEFINKLNQDTSLLIIDQENNLQKVAQQQLLLNIRAEKFRGIIKNNEAGYLLQLDATQQQLDLDNRRLQLEKEGLRINFESTKQSLEKVKADNINKTDERAQREVKLADESLRIATDKYNLDVQTKNLEAQLNKEKAVTALLEATQLRKTYDYIKGLTVSKDYNIEIFKYISEQTDLSEKQLEFLRSRITFEREINSILVDRAKNELENYKFQIEKRKAFRGETAGTKTSLAEQQTINAMDLGVQRLGASLDLQAIKDEISFAESTAKVYQNKASELLKSGEGEMAAYYTTAAEFENLRASDSKRKLAAEEERKNIEDTRTLQDQYLEIIKAAKDEIEYRSKFVTSFGSLNEASQQIWYQIGADFESSIENSMGFVQGAANIFTGAVDTAATSFVDAVIEGKDILESMKEGLRSSLIQSIGDLAKDQLKQGLMLGIGQLPMFKRDEKGNLQNPALEKLVNVFATPEQKMAAELKTAVDPSIAATTAIGTKVDSSATTITTNATTNANSIIAAINNSAITISSAVQTATAIQPSIPTGMTDSPTKITAESIMGRDLTSTTFTAKRNAQGQTSEAAFAATGNVSAQDIQDAQLSSIKATARYQPEDLKISGGILDTTGAGNKIATQIGEKSNWLTANLTDTTIAGFASIATAIAAGGSTKKSILGGVLGIAGVVLGNMVAPGIGGMIGGQIGAMVGARGFANGGVMTSNGSMPLHMYAKGGVANSPQLAMFGEGRKPEAYVPLPDGRSIPVTMQGSGGNVNNISVNVAVDNKGNSQTSTGGTNSEDYSQKLGTAISNAVKSEIANQQRPGGLLYRGRR